MLGAGAASAFTFGSPVSDPCHENLTADAIRAAGWPDGRAPPSPDRDDRVLCDNLLFDPPGDLVDRWSLSALIGVRHNDLDGGRPTEVDHLARVHNDGEAQAAHCLRASEHDDAEGDHAALAACRRFVLDEIDLALGEADRLDAGETRTVRISLKYQEVDVELSRFAFHMGRALHALQDGFTHAFRHPDAPRVVLSVFNYVDSAFERDYGPARDGYPHTSSFDTCRAGENRFRVRAATEASTAVWAAVVAPGDRAERRARAESAVDAWLTPPAEPCGPANGYCGALGPDGEPIPALAVPDPHAPRRPRCCFPRGSL